MSATKSKQTKKQDDDIFGVLAAADEIIDEAGLNDEGEDQDSNAASGQGAPAPQGASAPQPAAAAPAAASPVAGSAASAADEDDDDPEATKAVKAALAAIDPALRGDSQVVYPDESNIPSGERLDPVQRPSGEFYRPRILRHKTDVELLREARKAGIPVMLYGYPGCGKTALVEAAFGEELVTVECHGDIEVADLVGTWVQQPDGNYAWVKGPLVVAMEEGRPLFLDDVTLSPAVVLARLYPAMDGRGRLSVREHEGEIVTAQDGFYVVGAHNPGVEGAILSDPLRSRFLIHVSVETDLRMALDMGINANIVHATAALHKQRAELGSWAPEMRELIAFQRTAEALGPQIAADALIGAAPEESQDQVRSAIKQFFPEAETLRLTYSD